MDYGKMIRESFALAWKYKSLWLLGLFSGLGGGFNTSFGKHGRMFGGEGSGDNPFGAGGNPEALLGDFWHYIAPFLFAIALFGLVCLVMYCISTPALIDAVNRITRGGTYKFSDSFSTGIDFFWRTLGFMILSIMTAGLGLCIIVAVVAVLFAISFILGILSLIVVIPGTIFLVFVFAMIALLAQRALVVRNVSIGDAVAEGYALFRAHFVESLKFFLLLIGLGIGLGIAVGIVTFVVYTPVVLLAYSLGVELWMSFLIAVVLALPLSIPIGGYVGTFTSSLHTMFYFGLVEPGGAQMNQPATVDTLA